MAQPMKIDIQRVMKEYQEQIGWYATRCVQKDIEIAQLSERIAELEKQVEQANKPEKARPTAKKTG